MALTCECSVSTSISIWDGVEAVTKFVRENFLAISITCFRSGIRGVWSGMTLEVKWAGTWTASGCV